MKEIDAYLSSNKMMFNHNANLYDPTDQLLMGSDTDEEEEEQVVKDFASPSAIAPSEVIQEEDGNYSEGEGLAGVRLFVTDENRRDKLPFLLPQNHKATPMWQILGKFIKQDLLAVNLPITALEPCTILQKQAEMLANIKLLSEAARLKSEPIKRLILAAIFTLVQFHSQLKRTKIPVKSVLGETYEYASKDVLFLAEQVSHSPPIAAFNLVGDGFQAHGENRIKQDYQFGGGTGCLSFEQVGVYHFSFSQFGDEITVTKPTIKINNLVMGQMSFDLEGKVVAKNSRTGDLVEIDLVSKSWNTQPKMTGYGYDSQYNKLYEITGSWTNQVSVKNLRQCRTEQVWSEPASLDQSHRQYGFSAFTTHLNQVTDDMAQSVAPTDSRFRKDIQLLEQGKYKEAESEMTKIC